MRHERMTTDEVAHHCVQRATTCPNGMEILAALPENLHAKFEALIDGTCRAAAREAYRNGRQEQREDDARDLLSRSAAISQAGEDFALWMAKLWGYEPDEPKRKRGAR